MHNQLILSFIITTFQYNHIRNWILHCIIVFECHWYISILHYASHLTIKSNNIKYNNKHHSIQIQIIGTACKIAYAELKISQAILQTVSNKTNFAISIQTTNQTTNIRYQINIQHHTSKISFNKSYNIKYNNTILFRFK